MVEISPHYDKLLELLGRYLPHYSVPEPQVHCELNGGQCLMTFNASISVLGQTFTSPGPHNTANDAVEASARIAFEVLQELLDTMLNETSLDPGSKQLFAPLFQQLNCAGNAAPSVCSQLKECSRALSQELDDLESARAAMEAEAKKTAVESKAKPVNVAAPVKLKKSTISCPKADETAAAAIPRNFSDPISTLHEFVNKQQSSKSRAPIVFEDFHRIVSSTVWYGCKLTWGDRWWALPGTFAKKREAHMMAALMACVELLGPGYQFEGFDLKTYQDWTKESIRGECERFCFGYTEELLRKKQGAVSSGSNQANNGIEPSHVAEVEPPQPSAEVIVPATVPPAPNGCNYLSLLNELCQKARIAIPKYSVSTVSSVTNYFACAVRDFWDLPVVESSAFTRKDEAREDAAGKIYTILQERGDVDRINREFARMKIKRQAESSINHKPPRSPRVATSATVNRPILPTNPSHPVLPSISPVTVPAPSFPLPNMPPTLPFLPFTPNMAFDPQAMPVPPIFPVGQSGSNAALPDPNTFMQMMQQWQASMMSMYYSTLKLQQQQANANHVQPAEPASAEEARSDSSNNGSSQTNPSEQYQS